MEPDAPDSGLRQQKAAARVTSEGKIPSNKESTLRFQTTTTCLSAYLIYPAEKPFAPRLNLAMCPHDPCIFCILLGPLARAAGKGLGQMPRFSPGLLVIYYRRAVKYLRPPVNGPLVLAVAHVETLNWQHAVPRNGCGSTHCKMSSAAQAQT